MTAKYVNNSEHKDFIRKRWVFFIEELIKEDASIEKTGIGVITFPSDEMDDLRLFEENGFIGWEETETGNLFILKGRVVCFEKSAQKWKTIRTKLINAEVVQSEFEKYLGVNFRAFEKGSIRMFPVDVINLDYDNSISKNSLSMEVVMNIIFDLQSKFKKNFSLFMTWPKPHNPDADEPTFLSSLKETILENLNDPRATAFKLSFEEVFDSVDKMEYHTLSIIALTKKILAQACSKKYQIKRHEYYSYGNSGRQSMMSVLYHFEFIGPAKAQNAIYSEDVVKSLTEVLLLK